MGHSSVPSWQGARALEQLDGNKLKGKLLTPDKCLAKDDMEHGMKNDETNQFQRISYIYI